MIRIGLLPLYLALYDETCAYMRPRIEQYLETIVRQLEVRGVDVVRAPICRLKDEFQAAVAGFEQNRVQAVMTLHLAYSPSLESVDALAATSLPLVVLDTTESFVFDATVHPDEIMYNHGIHGVQDLCNLLRRRGKPYTVFAGHYQQSDVLDRAVRHCRGLAVAAAFKGARVGIVGSPFKGMGDFGVPFDALNRQFGMQIIPYDMAAGQREIGAVTSQAIAAERSADETRFAWDVSMTPELYQRATTVGLAVRRWVDQQDLMAFSINFLAAEEDNAGLPVMPFSECSKAMGRGIGYAGEGDVLTAALCGALLKTFPETTFTEMFCPDWRGGSVFLSHMGEINPSVCSEKPVLTEKDFPYTSADNTTVAYGTFKPGQVVLVNLAPDAGDRYTLILAPGDMLPVPADNRLKASVNGWFKPHMPLPAFLEQYSRVGGTHHSVLVYADCLPELTAFAAAMDFNCVTIA